MPPDHFPTVRSAACRSCSRTSVARRRASRTTRACGRCATRSGGRRPTTSWRSPSERVGLIPLGRTNVPELALMGTTEPDAYGPTHNPWNVDHSPGGSSGGSAAAVAAGLVPAAHANDIAGSIRIPASQCGLVGLKPTRGRVLPGRPADPAVGMNTEGVLTRTMRDTAGLLDAITDRSPPWAVARPGASGSAHRRGRSRPGPPPCRSVHRRRSPVPTSTPGCATAATDAATLLADLGHDVEDGAPNELFDPRSARRNTHAVQRQRRSGAGRLVGTARTRARRSRRRTVDLADRPGRAKR